MTTSLPPQPPAMFTDSLVTTAKHKTSRRKVILVWSSIILHLMGGAALFAASLMSFEVLERPPIKGVFNAPPPPPPPPPPPKKHTASTPIVTPVIPIVRPTPTTIRVPTHVVETPKEVAPQDAGGAPDSGTDDGVEGGVEGGVAGGVVGGVVGGTVGGVLGSADSGNIVLKEYEVSEPPKLISSEDPVYPEVARQQGLDGKVILELVIDENGSVIDARITRSDNVIFNASAIASVKKRRYTAARNNGRAVRTYKSVTIVYKLH